MSKRALLSVTDKTGIVDFASRLVERGWKVISTGGTAKTLIEAGVPCTLVEEVTGFPEMLDGRLKTLHPKVHGGILANRSVPAHMEAIKAAGIEPIDLVAVNLYAFGTKPGIENIDIGGPTLLRAAAKNGATVIPIVDPSDYDWVVGALDSGYFSIKIREILVHKVFRHTSAYDEAIAVWMEDQAKNFVPFLSSVPSSH
jgi:phosphoribosylaminoimidazolecarboxamide formyltransferase / IMP cyclohydrolase